ncbi:ParA family protein [Candidatus Woesearchaeota archaeon]|nr:ParA family protein [Candidatus Woesearchaeota archaeon]
MRKICVINQKGGVGKTTTSVNLAAGLSRNDRKVLLIDMDPQGNIGASLHFEGRKDIYDLLIGNAKIQECITPLGKNLDLISSKETLTKADALLSRKENSQFLLSEKLKKIKNYDYIIIDASPSLSILNQNALIYCDEAFIPVPTDYLGFDALKKMIKAVLTINHVFETDTKITKIIPTMYDKRNKICKEFLQKMRNEFYDILAEPIRVNSKLKEAPKYGQSIFHYDGKSRGAHDYMQLVKSVFNDEKQPVELAPIEATPKVASAS